MVSKIKDGIGSKLSEREGLNAAGNLRQVGIKPVDPADTVTAGAHLMAADGPVDAAHNQGYVTSACYLPNLGDAARLGFSKTALNAWANRCVLSAL